MQRHNIARHLLRIALIIVFGDFGISKLTSPFLWIGWIPPWMEGLLGISAGAWLTVIAVAEITIALLLLIPKAAVQKLGAILACAHLVAVLSQVGLLDPLGIRDLGLLLGSLALYALL